VPILDVSGALAKCDQLVVLSFPDYYSTFTGRLAQAKPPITGQAGIFLLQDGGQKNFQAVVKCIS